jgi:hypothetical protein
MRNWEGDAAQSTKKIEEEKKLVEIHLQSVSFSSALTPPYGRFIRKQERWEKSGGDRDAGQTFPGSNYLR